MTPDKVEGGLERGGGLKVEALALALDCVQSLQGGTSPVGGWGCLMS